MKNNRRQFITQFGAAGIVASVATVDTAAAQAAPARKLGRGMAKNLTLLTMRRQGRDTLGVKTSKGVLDVAQAAAQLKMYAPATADDLLQNEDGPSLQALVDAALKSSATQAAFLKEESVEYGPLVSRPSKIVCVGLNYRRHAHEVGLPIPQWPVLFNKFNGSLNRHKGTVKLPVHVAQQFDYEVELVIVMGKRASHVSESEAASYIAGFATGNDVSARDLLGRGGQWMLGKALDEFAPLGPHMVTADQVDGDNLKLECRVNGQTRQSSNTSDMVFNTRQIVSYVSDYFALNPGDVIFTGTPEGVIFGMPKEKQVWLKAGDRIECSVEKLGELRFQLV